MSWCTAHQQVLNLKVKDMTKEKYAKLILDTLDMSFEEWQIIALRYNHIEVEGNEIDWRVVAYLTADEYSHQLSKPSSLWFAPHTSFIGWFDDEYFEEQFN